jgi:hypothetical protein
MTANELADWVIDQFPYGGFQTAKKVAFMLQQQAQEIEQLKQDAKDCTCQGGHSEAYLKAKGKL